MTKAIFAAIVAVISVLSVVHAANTQLWQYKVSTNCPSRYGESYLKVVKATPDFFFVGCGTFVNVVNATTGADVLVLQQDQTSALVSHHRRTSYLDLGVVKMTHANNLSNVVWSIPKMDDCIRYPNRASLKEALSLDARLMARYCKNELTLINGENGKLISQGLDVGIYVVDHTIVSAGVNGYTVAAYGINKNPNKGLQGMKYRIVGYNMFDTDKISGNWTADLPYCPFCRVQIRSTHDLIVAQTQMNEISMIDASTGKVSNVVTVANAVVKNFVAVQGAAAIALMNNTVCLHTPDQKAPRWCKNTGIDIAAMYTGGLEISPDLYIVSADGHIVELDLSFGTPQRQMKVASVEAPFPAGRSTDLWVFKQKQDWDHHSATFAAAKF